LLAIVIPAKAGIHDLLGFLDARLRGHDSKKEFFSTLLKISA
jgi:hypothetical protein